MKIPNTLLVVAAAVALGACDDATGPHNGVPLSLSVAVAPGATAAATIAGAVPVARAETFTDGTNELIVDYAALVVREIELERLLDDDCDLLEGSDDECEEFEVGPFLLELPLDGTVDQVFTIEVRPDTYDELEFEIHKPGDDTPEERDFVLANPDFDDVSIRVEGTWNGTAFVFLQDLNAEQEIEFASPLVVAEGAAPLNVTLSLDISGWFKNGSGGLIDPATANKGGENEDVVEANIERSIEIFEDDDRDGEDDHHEGSSGEGIG